MLKNSTRPPGCVIACTLGLLLVTGAVASDGERIRRGSAKPDQGANNQAFSAAQYASITDCPFEPGCPALVLLEELKLDNTYDHAQFRHRKVVKIFTQQGVDANADEVIENPSDAWTILAPTGGTTLPNGTFIPIGEANVSVKALRAGGRVWLRENLVRFPGVVPGAIVDCSWTEISNYPADFTRFIWSVQREIPVLKSTLQIIQGDVRFSGIDAGLQRFKVDFSNPKGEGYFVARNIPSLRTELQSPPSDLLRFRIHFFLAELEKDWLGEVAGIAAGKAGAFIDRTPAVAAKVAKLVAPGDPPLTKLKTIYRFVQENIGTEEKRPESIGEEKRGRDINADDTLARGYGNEQERTFIFLAMSKAAGLESALLLVASRSRGILSAGTPDWSQFDTFAAAVRIGTDWTYYDPATKHCAFGMVAPEKENLGANALLIAPRKGAGATRQVRLSNRIFIRHELEPYHLVSVPNSAVARNTMNRETHLRLLEDGAAEAEVTESGTGLVDLEYRRRYELLDETDRRAAFTAELTQAQPLARLTSVAFEDVESYEKPATLRYRFTIPGLVSELGTRLILSPSIFDSLRPNQFSAETREASIVFPHTLKRHDRVVIQAPEGYEAEALPERLVIQEGPLMYACFFSRELDSIVFTRHEEIDTIVLSAADYPRLKAFSQKVQQADRQVLTFTRRIH